MPARPLKAQLGDSINELQARVAHFSGSYGNGGPRSERTFGTARLRLNLQHNRIPPRRWKARGDGGSSSFGYGQALIKQKHPKFSVKKKVPLYIMKR